MSASTVITESRTVGQFDRVVLRAQHENHLTITQGDREALTIRGPADLVPRIEAEVRQGTLVIGTGGDWLEKLADALTTSLTRPQIRYHLTVKQLSRLEVCAMASVHAPSLKSEHLVLKFSGTGALDVDSIDASLLEVELSGAGRVELAGYALEQKVTVSGPSEYDAAKLESQRAKITLRGIGAAMVWAVRELEVTMRGPGRVGYYGSPRIRKKIAPMGSLSCIG